MNYLKVTFQIVPLEEWFRDLLIANLGETGFDSFVETDSGIEAYIVDSAFNKSEIEQILLLVDDRFYVSYSIEETEDKNWNEEWEKNYFSPLLVAGKCLVRAPFHTKFPAAEIEIIIEPNMAFGTGNHETTSLMMEFLLGEEVKNKSVLDMGCGTGILAILASILGAKPVTAIDIDEWSFRATNENAALNKITGINVFKGDSSLLKSGNYDLIFANIQRNVILNDLPAYESVLNKTGKLLVSGFYLHDLEIVKNRAFEVRLNLLKSVEKNNWVVCVFSKD